MENYEYHEHLETKRMLIRYLTVNDISAWAEFFREREAVKFFTWLPEGSPEAMASHWINRQLDRYANRTFGLQALIDRHTGVLVGQSGLLIQEVNGIQETEVSYHVIKKYWGNGFAPEAARTFIHFAFKTQVAESVISIIDKKNIRSQKVAEKNGLKIDGETMWFENEVFIYRIRKKDWNF